MEIQHAQRPREAQNCAHSFSAIIPPMLSVNILDELNRSLERLLPRLLINHERGYYSMAVDQRWSPCKAEQVRNKVTYMPTNHAYSPQIT